MHPTDDCQHRPRGAQSPVGQLLHQRLDGFRSQRVHAEHALAETPQRFTASDPVETLDVDLVVASSQRTLVSQPTLTEPLQVARLGVVRSVNDLPVLQVRDPKARLRPALTMAYQVRGGPDVPSPQSAVRSSHQTR